MAEGGFEPFLPKTVVFSILFLLNASNLNFKGVNRSRPGENNHMQLGL
jgi:hypothetical protein